MDKVLTTALLTIAAIVAAVMVVNAILPAVSTGGASVVVVVADGSGPNQDSHRDNPRGAASTAVKSTSGSRTSGLLRSQSATRMTDVFVEGSKRIQRYRSAFDEVRRVSCRSL